MPDHTDAPVSGTARPRPFARQLAWVARNPIARRAHLAVQRAVQTGALVREPCEVCGTRKTDAHHPNYAEPLRVVWLCRRHHKAEHRAMRCEEAAPTQVRALTCGGAAQPQR